MDASPAASMVDGSVILGSKDTSLLVLDAMTGELIEEMAALGGRIIHIADMFGECRTPNVAAVSLHLLRPSPTTLVITLALCVQRTRGGTRRGLGPIRCQMASYCWLAAITTCTL